MKIQIFVEGIADKVFIRDFVSFHFHKELNDEHIVVTGGSNVIEKDAKNGGMVINKMQINTDNGGANLMIFDADNDFQAKKTQIRRWKETQSLDFELFLWPDNNQNGDLEVMLENIINPVNTGIFECWDRYEDCLKDVQIEGRNKPLTIPARKTKIYGYLETLHGRSNSQKEKAKERNRNYQIKAHWNLNADFLKPLKLFLEKHFS